MKKLVKNSLLGLTLLPIAAQAAIGIDSMIQFTENHKAEFTITNSSDQRQFIHVGITQLDVKDGALIDVPYTRENIDDWTLTVRPARTVVDPNLSKKFQVNYEPKVAKKDQAYQLSFIPTPYFSEGEAQANSIKVAVGFAPVVIVPAEKDAPIKYQARYTKDGLWFENHGETYLRAVLDACPKGAGVEARKLCSSVVNVLSGRHLTIPLTSEMTKASELKVDLSTYNYDFKHEFSLKPGQSSTNEAS
ncbi:hypothetical protein [Vibrio jasicida]|uniref:hypothetical protein n=1 Tax=Vibrio jasicida TaxID=766224 RepID=UPI0005EE3D4E|nr:hypothetical protein [Vibrio jasicida]